MEYLTLAYYQFKTVTDPHQEVLKHKVFFASRDITSRIYISTEGINGQISGPRLDIDAYKNWLETNSPFQNITFKSQPVTENIFPRATVKYRPQLVACDQPANLNLTAKRVSPKEWKQMLKSGQYQILDVRNDYESKIGHFEGSHLPPLSNFRQFPDYADKLLTQLDPNTPLMTYCTGGIRCELYTSILKQKGFSQVYQLDGGVINYSQQEGAKYWKGKLFVFDDRMAIDIGKETLPPISLCDHCSTPSDTYYNCANFSCNHLFIACEACLITYQGCCGSDCAQLPASKRRPFSRRPGNKPFRRKHLVNQQ